MLGDFVRTYRRTLGWSQEDLADKTGVSVRGIRKIEARRTGAPRPVTVRLLADAFGLRGGERDRFCQSALVGTAEPGAATSTVYQPVTRSPRDRISFNTPPLGVTPVERPTVTSEAVFADPEVSEPHQVDPGNVVQRAVSGGQVHWIAPNLTAVSAGPDDDLSTRRTKPVVRFVATSAGRVAYSLTGSGPALVLMLGWVSHLDMMWENANHRRLVEVLARKYTVIRYDKVGCGLSEQVRTDFTMEFELAVLEALVEHLDLKRFALLGSCEAGQVATAYAVRHPGALSSLIVYGSCARGADLAPDEIKRSVLGLVRTHWGLGSRVLADIFFPDAPSELTAMFARVQRAAATAAVAASLLDMFYRFDVSDLLPKVRVSTLVVHRRGSRAVRFELGRELATLIPGAQLAVLDGRMQPIDAQDPDSTAATLLSFLRDQNGERRSQR